MAALGSSLPDAARRLWNEVSLHDSSVMAVERAPNRLEIVLRAGQNQTGYFDARLRYEDVVLSPTDEQFLRNAIGRRDTELLYDEFDSSDAQWVHHFLFWPYREVVVQFGALTLAITPVGGRE